jgi:hypothetical protein
VITEEGFITLITRNTAYASVSVMHHTSPYQTLSALQGALLKHETRGTLKTVAKDPNDAEEEGNAEKNEAQKAGCKSASHVSSSTGFAPGRGKGKGRNTIPEKTTKPVPYIKKPIVCWSCGCTAHLARLCPDRQPPNGRFRPPAEPSDANNAVI